MPNIITHALCAHDVLEQISDLKLKQAILKYPRVFSMASSGPDFLFYYKALSFQFSFRPGKERVHSSDMTYENKEKGKWAGDISHRSGQKIKKVYGMQDTQRSESK